MKRALPKTRRCAIYARQSSDEGRHQEFGSLEAQDECCDAFIRSQASEGWTRIPNVYADGGFSGGNTKRPALQRLLADIEDDLVDCVVVYKLDRFTRSLRDFFIMLEVLERKNVAFVAVTQQFNTATSAGRLMLSMLLAFAQFEREIVSERTRDKIALARKKGKWTGGRPPLGYDIDRQSKRLVINEDEAEQVRAIFRLYIEYGSVLTVVQELHRRGWRTKAWTTSKGEPWGGCEFNKSNVLLILRNVVYAGLIRHLTETYSGEHEAIVDEKAFESVQDLLKRHARTGGATVRNKHGAVLRGLLRCAHCKCLMGHSFSRKRGGVLYRYYLCRTAQTKGWGRCPAPSVSASAIESAVVDRIRGVARDSQLIAETVRQARNEITQTIKALESEHKRLRKNRSVEVASRLDEIGRELDSLRSMIVTEKEVVAAFARFDELWAALTPREQERIVRLLVKRIDWDGQADKVTIEFHQTGLRGLVDEANERRREEAA